MSNLASALNILRRMAHLLDTANLAAPTRYDRVTNEYAAALESAYRVWARATLKRLSGDSAEQKVKLLDAAGELTRTLQNVGTEHLPYAVTAIGVADYVPSPEAWRMIADSIDTQNQDIGERLVPLIVEKLQRGIDEQTDLGAVADSLTRGVSAYAGNLWATIQRLVGDFAAQAETRDDLVYRARWVRVQDDHSCESCINFAGEYPSYEALLQATQQCVPGYFVTSPFKSCWLNCRCWIELFIKGKWVRV